MKKIGLVALAGVLALNANAEDVVVEEAAVEQSCFDAVYGGLGIGGSFLKVDDEKFNRFIGTVVLGGGKAFKGKYYLGAEALFDFTGSKSKSITDNGEALTLDNKGFRPQLNVRLGYVFNNDNMVYLKAGMGYSKVKASYTDESINYNKWAPIIALGGEKAFCNKFSAGVEAEYAFGKKEGDTRFNKGWNVRALIKYNIKY